MSKRTDSIKREHENSGSGNAEKWYYVDLHKLERLGISQYKSEPGDNIFRIIPQQDPEAFFMKEVYLHYKIGADGHNILCAKRMWDEPCPICAMRDKIIAADSKDETEKALRYSRRFLVFVVDTKNQEEMKKGLRWYDAPSGFKSAILALSKNPRKGTFIDVSDPEEGGDIMFVREGKGLNTKYLGFQILHDGELPALELYAATPETFEEVLKHPVLENTQALLDGFTPIAPEEEKKEEPKEEKKEEPKEEKKEEPKEEKKEEPKEEKKDPPFDADKATPKEEPKEEEKEKKAPASGEAKLSVADRIAKIKAEKKAAGN